MTTKRITITVHRPAKAPDPSQAAPFAAGVAWVSPWDRKVLLLKRAPGGPHPGTWCFPAGKIERGETPAEAAVREFREESGCWHEPRQRLLMPVWDDGRFCLYLYQGSKFGPILDGESDDFLWARLDRPPAPLHPNVEHQLRAIQDILNFNHLKVNQ